MFFAVFFGVALGIPAAAAIVVGGFGAWEKYQEKQNAKT